MHFTTPIPIFKSNHPIDYHSKIVSLGSCFAVNMAEKLDYFKFQNAVNPFGILFHPLALNKIIQKAVLREQFTESAVFFHNERWHCFDVHSDLSRASKDEFLELLNSNVKLLHEAIVGCSHLIITLGTSWVYRRVENGQLVANCHKVPQKEFKKILLSVEEITQGLEEMIKSVSSINPEAKIIFTISPVRHIKDGFVENQWSKANLISAVHQVRTQQSEIAYYFPSYEIMMDELRDYRFYAEDMIHPSTTAIDYIWKRFAETWVAESAFSMMQEVERIQRGLAHRSFHPDSEQHRKFLEGLQNSIQAVQYQFPFIQF
ncbi:GSCFA domain-containing protein [Flavobacterium sp. WW92]|uniref:GSCFA domain-containing protein n=1 Tax=unclassified Flavobacterium TaxID=196869 RepID=UPI002223FE0E|nr:MULTISPECIES: GSCFA domain-containing protein [unclassified Flavobacterium]WDO13166.1 GSCFA domain-containing protein [Flavobacterium sp. WW92]